MISIMNFVDSFTISFDRAIPALLFVASEREGRGCVR